MLGSALAQTPQAPIVYALPAPIPSSTSNEVQQFYFILPILDNIKTSPTGDWNNTNWSENLYRHSGKCNSLDPVNGGISSPVSLSDFVLVANITSFDGGAYTDNNLSPGYYCYARTFVVAGVEGPISDGWTTMLLPPGCRSSSCISNLASPQLTIEIAKK